MRIEACFDSHVHWAANGEWTTRLRLDRLTSPEDAASLKLDRAHYRGDWLTGSGWDETKWLKKPTRAILDQLFPGTPVAFSRCDAHALWVNTEALKRSGILAMPPGARGVGGRVERDPQGAPTGVLVDQAMEAVQDLIPPLTPLEMRRHLLKGAQNFNEAGFTHIRDMTCDATQWNEAFRLDDAGLLMLAVEEYFWLKNSDGLSQMFALLTQARQAQTANLRVKGLKLFLDGALGSEGAWLSRCYHGREHSGLVLWQKEELREVLLKCWEADFEIALHAIGDAAADWLVDLALELKREGHRGPLHLEHAEILRPETIAKIKDLSLTCHLQPAHWLSDRHWLKEKIGDLADHAFPWRRLQESDVPFDFGSDAPIEPASLKRTFQALRESAEAGIPRLLGSPANYMSHRDLSWAPNSYTILEDEIPKQVVFRGEDLF